MAAFDIGDVANLLDIKRLGSGDSFDVVCPYCGDTRGKMNFCIRKGGREVNLFHCFHCNAGGNMLTLYADLKGIYGEDRFKRAYREIAGQLRPESAGRNGFARESMGGCSAAFPQRAEAEGKVQVKKASPEAVDRAYRKLFSLLDLSGEHERKLADRGLSPGQIESLYARSIPMQEREELTRKLLAGDVRVKGVPGFYVNEQKDWSIAFPKSSGILFPIPDENGRWCAVQMRMDHVKEGRKYLWLSSAKYQDGVSSGSPAAFFGDMDGPEIAVTEGGLKAYCAWCFSGKPFIGLPGVGQAGSLKDFLKKKRGSGQTFLECMDMDKYMSVACDGQDRHCRICTEKDGTGKECPYKLLKRTSIREGCNRLYRMCEENGISYRRLKWNAGENGLWDGSCKGIDDRLLWDRQAASDGGKLAA